MSVLLKRFTSNILSGERAFCTSAVSQKYIPKKLAGKNVTAQNWLSRQLNDPFVKLAHQEGYRCRSAFKLIEIDDKFKLLHPGMKVVDCGAAPGSWTQVAVERATASGFVIAVDIQFMNPVPGAYILPQRDFTQLSTQQEILTLLSGKRADLILSDMAPNASGTKALDHDGIIHLALSAFKFSVAVLRSGGSFVCKIWQGDQQPKFEQLLQRCFTSVRLVKPKSSRSNSAEVFYVAQNYVPVVNKMSLE